MFFITNTKEKKVPAQKEKKTNKRTYIKEEKEEKKIFYVGFTFKISLFSNMY
jgi:hypothetical protein